MRSFTAALLFSITAVAASGTSHTATVHDLWQFPNGTWTENIAVRSNGQLLVTAASTPDLYQVDPFGGNPAELVFSFPRALGALGIAELEEDVFAVVAGNWSITLPPSFPHTYSLWKVDMNGFKSGTKNPSPANATKITDIPEAVFLNGLAILDKESKTVLVGDCGTGVVYRVNTHTGEYKAVLEDPLMQPPSNDPQHLVGIDGLHVHDGMLYWSNYFRHFFARMPINADGTAAGEAEVVVNNTLVDDFTFDAAGNIYVAHNSENTIGKITPAGVVTVIAGNLNSSLIAGPTAVQFGRTKLDGSVLYVTTTGGLSGPTNGTHIEGGKVLAISLE